MVLLAWRKNDQNNLNTVLYKDFTLFLFNASVKKNICEKKYTSCSKLHSATVWSARSPGESREDHTIEKT
jgi:hypothetical protein